MDLSYIEKKNFLVVVVVVVVRCHKVKNGKEASEITEGKSSRMR